MDVHIHDTYFIVNNWPAFLGMLAIVLLALLASIVLIVRIMRRK